VAIISSPLARARPGGGWLRELGRRLPGPEPRKTRHALALRRALPRVPLGHFSAWPPPKQKRRYRQDAVGRSRLEYAAEPRRRCTTYRNEGRRPARMPAPLSTRGLRERRSWRYANLVFLHRFWSWFRGALCKICDVFQRARRILSPLRLPVPPRPLWSLDQILSAISGEVE
jgi:hypothetical protein